MLLNWSKLKSKVRNGTQGDEFHDDAPDRWAMQTMILKAPGLQTELFGGSVVFFQVPVPLFCWFKDKTPKGPPPEREPPRKEKRGKTRGGKNTHSWTLTHKEKWAFVSNSQGGRPMFKLELGGSSADF